MGSRESESISGYFNTIYGAINNLKIEYPQHENDLNTLKQAFQRWENNFSVTNPAIEVITEQIQKLEPESLDIPQVTRSFSVLQEMFSGLLTLLHRRS